MTEQELNDKIRDAFTHATPNVLDSVRSRCETQKGTIIPLKQPEKKKNLWKRFASAAAALILALSLGTAIGVYHVGHAVAATVSLDVNPSIEITINRNEKVLEVIPLNEDAQLVIGTMDFSGSSLDVTVNALIGSMLRNGYLSDLANSILISVDDPDTQRGKQLEEKLAGEIDALLHTGTFDGSVLSQTITANTELETLAQQYGITAGKAQLIQQIVAQGTHYTFDALVSLSINELNLISESGSLQLEQVSSTGAASAKAYVGRDSAKALALAHAEVAEEDVLYWECELDYDDGSMVYELEFHTADGHHEYDIDALTGEVIYHEHSGSHHNDHIKTQQNENAPASSDSSLSDFITADQAKAAALAHAGVDEKDTYDWDVELDRDSGRSIYEVEFKSGRYEYSYDIDAGTGSVLRYEKEWAD